jgi:hypothetical protein
MKSAKCNNIRCVISRRKDRGEVVASSSSGSSKSFQPKVMAQVTMGNRKILSYFVVGVAAVIGSACRHRRSPASCSTDSSVS